MLPLGTTAPDFRLPDTNGKIVSRDDFKNASALLVMFICNHCPYVKHVRGELAKLGRDYQAKGVGIVAINSNDAKNYPDDNLEKMKEEVALAGYTFPYLFDETQSVAKAYRAACTPDIYLFDKNQKLVYRGQLDESRPRKRDSCDRKRFSRCARCCSRWETSFRKSNRPAWVATSSGSRATRRIIRLSMNFLGIEIGGTKLQLVVGNESATIHERFRFSVSAGEGAKGIRAAN